MSSYFVNPLFSKYKAGESLEPTYYDCRFPQSVARSHTLVYGHGAAAPGFQHPSHHVQDFFHHGTTGISNPGYQQNPCALACHGDATKFYGYEALPRQPLYGTQQEASLAQYPDCKSSNSTNPGEGQGHLSQNTSPSLMCVCVCLCDCVSVSRVCSVHKHRSKHRWVMFFRLRNCT